MARAESQPVAAADRVRWVELLRYRQTWAIFFCRFFADPLWFFYVFWMSEFLARERGLNLAGIAAVAWIPFLVADVSNFSGGSPGLRLQRAGWSVNRTRKTLMVMALHVAVGILAVFSHSSVLDHHPDFGGHLFWMSGPSPYTASRANTSRPRRSLRLRVGGTGSTIGSVISTWAVGRTLDATHSYVPVFIGLGLLMPIALLAGTALMGRVESR